MIRKREVFLQESSAGGDRKVWHVHFSVWEGEMMQDGGDRGGGGGGRRGSAASSLVRDERSQKEL